MKGPEPTAPIRMVIQKIRQTQAITPNLKKMPSRPLNW
eukprot:CAMPEP_0194121556 /NCGR_PEP_ID=MMETSP0150-20130528/47495_1 /TAXON_ID=122233 /ORGANISM="Chaetoceros debilis, Strain MM31A-1" /LENGTH=37 /DNA_ID= /DNA_START= /DNA_END= /DNA_ORIENTATION=